MNAQPQLGAVRAIWLKRAKRGPMDAVISAKLVAGKGLAGNSDQGGKRQVTILAEEAWDEALAELKGSVPPAARRANILVHGIALQQSRGRTLKIGTCRIRIYGETAPCERMDEALPGLQQALSGNWRGGAFGEVLDDGVINIGDPVVWDDTSH